MRVVEQATFPHPDAAAGRGARRTSRTCSTTATTADKELARRILVTGSPLYRRAFNKLLLAPAVTPEEQRAANAASAPTDAPAATSSRYVFDPTIVPIGAHTADQPLPRSACTVEQIVGTNTLEGR